ncbi:MAG: 50S ribosomal protein L18 [Pseudomonadota bacterium]|jgi:large subunit ribosomal protein L18
MEKKSARLRRARRGRAKMRELGMTRLCVHRTPRHIYAQLIAADGASVLASASSLLKEVRDQVKATGNVDTAALVGRLIAERGREAGVTRIAFDRSGFQYHGRIKALADAARAGGLEF